MGSDMSLLTTITPHRAHYRWRVRLGKEGWIVEVPQLEAYRLKGKDSHQVFGLSFMAKIIYQTQIYHCHIWAPCKQLRNERLLKAHWKAKLVLTGSSMLRTEADILSIAMLTPMAVGTGPRACGPLNWGICRETHSSGYEIEKKLQLWAKQWLECMHSQQLVIKGFNKESCVCVCKRQKQAHMQI